MTRRGMIVGFTVALAVLAAGGVWLWSRLSQPDPGAFIPGLAAASPHATPEAEYILPGALEAARAEAGRINARALVVHRHGHRVFEYYTGGRGGERVVEGAELTALTEALGLGCCKAARIDDWMRVGDLLLGEGTYQGDRLVAPEAVRAALARRVSAPWQGDEPPLARDAFWFDLDDGARLWLAPQRGLAVLLQAGRGAAHDPAILNIILRGLVDPPPPPAGGLTELVPGH